MSGLGDSVGEGGDGGIDGNRFNTGFQTHFGAGNVDAGMKSKKGAGYDEEGNVKTHLASPMSGFHYDPVTGALAPEEEVLGGGGGFLGGYKDAIPGNFPRSYQAPQDDRDFIALERGAIFTQGRSTAEARPVDGEAAQPRDGGRGGVDHSTAQGGSSPPQEGGGVQEPGSA